MAIIAICVLALCAVTLIWTTVLLNRVRQNCDNAIKICEDAVKSLKEKGV